jgi:hypothetical protein
MKILKQCLSLVLIAVIAIYSSGCGSAYQTAVKAGVAVDKGIDAGTILIQEFVRSGVLSQEKGEKILKYCDGAKKITEQINRILASNSTLSLTDKEKVFALIDSLLDGIEAFQKEGLLNFIGDQKSQDAIYRVVLGLRLALKGIEAFLSTQLISRIQNLERTPTECYAAWNVNVPEMVAIK